MKHLWICTLLLPVLLSSCKDRFPPEAEEYFSFYADGEFFYYPQERGLGFGGTGQTLKAKKSGTTAYRIYAYSRKDPVATGAVSFEFSENHIPDKDTIFLDGSSNTVSVLDLKTEGNSFVLAPPLMGKITFYQRNMDKLTGTFEFQASQSTGKVLTVTEGKFSIIPSK